MKFPKGKPIYEDTPSGLINLKELVAWIRMEKFSGVLEGKVSDIKTQILITEGEPRKAFTYKDGELLLQDEEAIDSFVTDAMMRVSFISLYNLEEEIMKSILLKLFSNPILNGELKIFDPTGIIDKCLEKSNVSHLDLILGVNNFHFLFYDGKYLGYYNERDGEFVEDQEKIGLIQDLNSKLGYLYFYNMSIKEFEGFKFPSLKFGEIEKNIDFLIETLIDFLNQLVTGYISTGIYPDKVKKILEKVFLNQNGLMRDSIILAEDQFMIKQNVINSWYEAVNLFANFIKELNKELVRFWGKKLLTERYTEVYKNYYEKIKDHPELSTLFSYLSPENIIS